MAEDAAVVVTFRADLKAYEAALKSAVRATEKAADAANKAVSTIGKGATGGGGAGQQISRDFAKSTGQIVNDARVMQFQLNDIFSGLATGGGVRSLQMQMGQITQLLSGGTLAQGAKTIGTALLGMINPISLAIVGFGIAATVAADYFSSVEEKSKEAAKALKTVADQIDEIAKKHPDSTVIKEIADQTKNAADAAQDAADKQAILNKIYEDAQSAFRTTSVDLTNLILLLQDMGIEGQDVGSALTTAMRELGTAIKDRTDLTGPLAKVEAELHKAEELGIGIAGDYAKALAAVAAAYAEASKKGAEANEAFNNSGTIMLQVLQNLSGPLGMFVAAMRALSGIDLSNLSGAFLKLPFELGTLADQAVVATPSAAKTFLKSHAEAGRAQDRIDQLDDDLAKSLAKLFTLLPESARIISSVRTTAEQAEIWERSGHGTKFAAAPPGKSRHEKGGAVDIGGVSADVLQRAVEQAGGLMTGRGFRDPMHVQSLHGAADAAKEASTAFDELYASNQRLLEQRLRENEINRTVKDPDERVAALQAEKAAAEEAKIAEQLLAAAKQQHGTITPALTAQINEQAHAMAQAGLAADQLAVKQKNAAKAADDLRQQQQQFAQQIAGMAQSALGGFISDLRAGVDAGEAFNNMLNRILDSMIQMSLQALLSPQLFSSLLGFPAAPSVGLFAKGGIVGGSTRSTGRINPLAFAGAPSMATGGMVGGGVPIIAHKGEMIVPKNQVGRGGGNITNNVGDIAIDMSGAGVVASSTESGKQLGKQLQGAVELILVRESRPGGILRRVGTA